MSIKKILFLCTGNSCRSQMAEGFAKHYLGDKHDFYSAGIEAHGINPLAVKVMAEKKIDISNYKSKTLNDIANINFDVVITVCGDAHERCPTYLKKATIIHKGFQDPAKAKGTEEEVLQVFRDVRDQIEKYITFDIKAKYTNLKI
ncbi:MAG: arsenate reductase ArsC [Spirochaetota bacterium]|nr:arsenate reductase ArsC [Spirochaetota bacterium]